MFIITYNESRSVPNVARTASVSADDPMDLTKFGFTTSKEGPQKNRKSKESYEKKRPRLFIESWKDEFPGLQYTESHDEGDAVAGPSTSSSRPDTQDLGIMFCQTCRDYDKYSDHSSSMFIGTSKFRKDTLTSHWKSRAHIRCSEKKEVEQAKSRT